MKIKEIEYGKTISHNYNNYRVVLRVEVEENDDIDAVIEKLREEVDSRIAKEIAESSLEGVTKRIRERIIAISDMLSEIENSAEFHRLKTAKQIIKDIEIVKKKLDTAKKRFNELFGNKEVSE